MIPTSINQSISRTIKEFDRLALTEDVHDWQGNKTTNQNNIMMVQRNVFLSMVIPPDAKTLERTIEPDLPWAEDHFIERLAGPSNPGNTYKYWPYHTDLDNDEKYKKEVFSHTYQERYWPKRANPNFNIQDSWDGQRTGIRFQYGDLEDVISLLKNNPTTRQAYLPIWFPEDTWAANNQERVPCSLGYYFYIERGKLHCNYTIRSCDLFRHFRNDIYLTARLLQTIAVMIGIEPGNLNMIIYNLHLFKNDIYPFKQKEKKLKTWKE